MATLYLLGSPPQVAPTHEGFEKTANPAGHDSAWGEARPPSFNGGKRVPRSSAGDPGGSDLPVTRKSFGIGSASLDGIVALGAVAVVGGGAAIGPVRLTGLIGERLLALPLPPVGRLPLQAARPGVAKGDKGGAAAFVVLPGAVLDLEAPSADAADPASGGDRGSGDGDSSDHGSVRFLSVAAAADAAAAAADAAAAAAAKAALGSGAHRVFPAVVALDGIQLPRTIARTGGAAPGQLGIVPEVAWREGLEAFCPADEVRGGWTPNHLLIRRDQGAARTSIRSASALSVTALQLHCFSSVTTQPPLCFRFVSDPPSALASQVGHRHQRAARQPGRPVVLPPLRSLPAGVRVSGLLHASWAHGPVRCSAHRPVARSIDGHHAGAHLRQSSRLFCDAVVEVCAVDW